MPSSTPTTPDARWDASFACTMQEEGVRRDAQGTVLSSGLNTTPGDPGGTTNFGFAQRFNPDIDVTTLVWDTAKQRAYTHYWLKAGCDKLNWPACLIFFDTCFNQSFSEAQALPYSGYSGDWEEMLWKRLEQYAEKHPANPSFTRWWLLRVLHIKAYIEEHPHV
jgi:hypothetical protein